MSDYSEDFRNFAKTEFSCVLMGANGEVIDLFVGTPNEFAIYSLCPVAVIDLWEVFHGRFNPPTNGYGETPHYEIIQ